MENKPKNTNYCTKPYPEGNDRPVGYCGLIVVLKVEFCKNLLPFTTWSNHVIICVLDDIAEVINLLSRPHICTIILAHSYTVPISRIDILF